MSRLFFSTFLAIFLTSMCSLQYQKSW
jgi:hypothetical protein